MPAAGRIGDSSNHGGVVVGAGVPTVMIGGMPAAVLGDTHTCPIVPTVASPHLTSSPFIMGSATVMIGGKPALRSGDSAACGAALAIGAPTVSIGG